MKNKKTLIIIAVIVVLIIAGCWIFGGAKAKSKVDFATEKAQIGSVSNSITATGTIEPVTEVEVGTQVSGIIDKIYVDYNSIVKQGEVIAEMDRVTLLSDLQCTSHLQRSKSRIRIPEKALRTKPEIARKTTDKRY